MMDRTDVEVLYEDNHLLVLAKPACMPTVPDSSGDFSLLDWGKRYLKVTRNKPGNVFLAVIHRVDRPVSGIICFGITSKAASRLSDQLRRKKFRKRYLAVVEGRFHTAKLTIANKVIKDRSKNVVKALSPDSDQKGAKLAITEIELLEITNGLSLLMLTPITGRPHQLRVQCSTTGFPIKGDIKYGAAHRLPDCSIALHSVALEFEHPTRKKKMSFFHAPPESEPWNLFSVLNHPDELEDVVMHSKKKP